MNFCMPARRFVGCRTGISGITMNTYPCLVRSLLLLGMCALVHGAARAQADLTLAVSDVHDGIDTLRWGMFPEATSGRDQKYGEQEYPPAPPEFLFDARWVDVGPEDLFGEGVRRNYHGVANERDTFQLRVQPNDGGYPVKLSWPDLTPYFGSARLRFVDGDGNISTVDMLQQREFIFSNSVPVSLVTIVTSSDGPATPGGGRRRHFRRE